MKYSIVITVLMSVARIMPLLGETFDMPAMSLTVNTKSSKSPDATFWYHIPENYDPARKSPYHVLVYFGGRDCSGENEARGKMGWAQWADANDVFLVCPGFKGDEYWEPAKWSGDALLKAFSLLAREYNVETRKVAYYGYSGGSQAANLFAAWKPQRCIVWVSHACGVFHEPNAGVNGIPALVTCGDADIARYVISRSFVERARRKGYSIIWKSYPNHDHDVPPESLALAQAFLKHYLLDGGKQNSRTSKDIFVGDDQDDAYYPASSPEAQFVPVEDRVYLPTREIADAWSCADSAACRERLNL